MFDNSKCHYAVICFGDKVIEGYCEYWEIPSNNGWIKLDVNGIQYITSLNNVLLTEEITSSDGKY